MWIASKYGFFSIACAHKTTHSGTERYWVPEPHPNFMMVRARKHSHLANLRKRFPQLPGIKKSAGTDYPYRIIAKRAVVLDVVYCLAEEIDYCNFKNAVADVMPKDESYKGFLHHVWAVGLKLTPVWVKVDRPFKSIRWYNEDGGLRPEPL